MINIFFVAMGYLWNDFVYVYFYKRIFREKYSSKTTFWTTIVLWIIQVVTKIIPIFVFGLDSVMFLSYCMLALHFVYLCYFFEGRIIKKVVAFLSATVVQTIMDLLGLNLTSMIVGDYELYKAGSGFTAVAAVASCATITIGTVIMTKVWQVLENINWKMTKKEWLCVILPVSQFFLMWQMAVKYSITYRAIPMINICGIVLAFAADIYMLTLFVKLSKKAEAEKELERLSYQYELEQVRYEQLKKSQEETAKIRHDFQNYLLTLKQME